MDFAGQNHYYIFVNIFNNIVFISLNEMYGILPIS